MQAQGDTVALRERELAALGPVIDADLGLLRTKAEPQADGSVRLTGSKIFISGGDHDLSKNILHLVLARTDDAPPGTKGLSLFFVPKFHFDHETGELGERNGVFVTNVEHKMGLKASATCELTFGQHDVPAVGWLVGEVHDGIAQMFQVIENARMMVGVKSSGTLSTGYLNALAYAKERVQGADLTTPAKDAPKAEIVHRTAQGKRKAPHRPAHARTPARPSTGPARPVPGHAPGLGPERAAGVVLREIHPGSMIPIQFLAPILILTRVAVRNWARR